MRRKITLGFVIVIVVMTAIYLLPYSTNDVEFNSEQWKNWTESEAELSLRWNMVNSLKENYELKGKTKEEIIKLLGEPQNRTNNEFYYYLGMSGFGINTGSLSLQFDEKNRVKNFKIWDG